MKLKYAPFVIALVVFAVAPWYLVWEHRNDDAGTIKATWMSEVARQVDPKFAGVKSGYVIMYMACGSDVPQPNEQPYGNVKLDVNIKTGALRIISKQLPAADFRCPDMTPQPAQAPRPMPPQAQVPAPSVAPSGVAPVPNPPQKPVNPAKK